MVYLPKSYQKSWFPTMSIKLGHTAFYDYSNNLDLLKFSGPMWQLLMTHDDARRMTNIQ